MMTDRKPLNPKLDLIIARIDPDRLQAMRDTESDFEEYVGEISDEEFDYYTGQCGGRYFA